MRVWKRCIARHKRRKRDACCVSLAGQPIGPRAYSALSAAGFFIDRLRSGLNRDAHQLLGADLVVVTDNPVPAAWREEAQRRPASDA